MKLTESGHLVLATVHSVTAMQIYERLISFFDEASRPDALYIMAHYLRLMINQRLIPRLCECARPASQADLSRIKRALAFVKPEQVILAPDCGMKYLPREVANGKLKAMVEGAKILRAEYGA
jgi:type II secretory ATPase GspE/PulE/Tfp pilus assembly ATPase PilB-like protein